VGDAALAAAILQYKARGTTFVVITQRTSVLGVADKLLLLRDGAMQAFGPRDEVMASLQKASQEAQARTAQQRAAATAAVAVPQEVA
jgi:ATP-binding cassette, subfamily C, bacterial exporter for protease/lipase